MNGKLRPRPLLTAVTNVGMQVARFMQSFPPSLISEKHAVVKMRMANAIEAGFATSCIFDLHRNPWCLHCALVNGWNEGSTLPRAKVGVEAGSLASEKVAEEGVQVLSEAATLAKIAGQGSSK
jgi:hypothetical protein